MLISLGIDFRGTGFDARERFRLREEDLRRLYERPIDPGISELVALGTCNRVELYGWVEAESAPELEPDFTALARLWRPEVEARHLLLAVGVRRSGAAVATHLLRVAAGLESQILGDAQILGQIRRAYRMATERHSVGRHLHRLFQAALRTGRRVRAETGLVAVERSAGSTAVDVALQRLGALAGRRFVVVGSGKTGAQAARRLARLGVTEVVIANRTPASAEALAREMGGRAAPLATVHQELAQAEVAIVATAAEHPLITATALEAARRISRTSDRRLLLLDLSMPRNVEPAVGLLRRVTVLDLDTPGFCQRHQRASILSAVPAAEAIVEGEQELAIAPLPAFAGIR